MVAQPSLRDLPAHVLRTGFLWASNRRSLARLATATPLTRRLVLRFVAGDDLGDALIALRRARDAGFRTTVDVLGETVDSVDEARAAADRYIEAIDALSDRGLDVNVSLKLTQMGLDIGEDVCRENLGRVLDAAEHCDAFVRVDMEDHTRADATLAIARAMRPRHLGTGVVIQSYLRRSAEDVEQLIREGIRVRLCKGAYNEPATVAFPTRAEVDASYIALMERLLVDGMYPALATHDPKLIRHAIAFARERRIHRTRFEFQMLYGVRRDLQEQLVAAGYTVRLYVPYGREWYPYFMRRLAERPQNVLFVLSTVLREGRRGS